MTDPTELPPRGTTTSSKSERIFRTCLEPRDYVNLEIESMERGMKPFGLTKVVMTKYVRKQLLDIKELPEPLQNQVIEYIKLRQTRS